MATSSQTSRGSISRARDQFREAVNTLDAGLPPAVSQAARSLLAALEYEDRPLIRSHLETAFAALTEAISDAIERRLDWSRQLRARFRQLAAEVGGSPGDEFDEVGRYVTADLDNVMRALTDMRDGSVREMNEGGVTVPGQDALHTEIRELEAFRASLIGGWPWSHLPLSAPDPAMLARARAETERGEGVPIEDLIRQIESGG